MMIRAVTAADLPAVLALNESAMPLVNSLNPQKLAWLVDISAGSWLAQIDGRVAGFVIALPPEADYHSQYFDWFCRRYTGFIYIDRIVVAEHARRAGIGLALLAQVEAFALARGQALASDLYETNHKSLAFHQKFGFEPVGRQQVEGHTILKLLKRPAAQ